MQCVMLSIYFICTYKIEVVALFADENSEKQRDQLHDCTWPHSYSVVKWGHEQSR